MPARHQRLLFAAAIGMCALLALGALTGHAGLLAYAGPLCLLALPLLAGRYVGEEKLGRLRRHRPAPRRLLPAGSLPQCTRRSAALLPRGGRLIAEALAVRPPPLSVTS
jgi:hypothetical protein